jgi:hypothetical protein
MNHRTTLRTSTLAGLMGILTISAVDFSSFCHPTDAGVATTDAVRRTTTTRTAPATVPVTEPVPVPDPVFVSESVPASAPVELTWQLLEDVDFKDVYIEEIDSYYWKPEFGGRVMAMEGKEVHLTGYLIPVDVDEDFYVLSRYPFANCFFCGGAGPESVVDLRWPSKDHRTYQTDERLTFKGTLRLNADDIYQMNYILDGAVEYTP